MISAKPVRIDPDLCTGCGLCIAPCPKDLLRIENGKLEIGSGKCMLCGHCAAACPNEAIVLSDLDQAQREYETFPSPTGWIGFGEYDTTELVRLMRSRRSCRNYTPKPVSREALQDLVKIGITAPSGTNSQKWTFTLLPTRGDVLALGADIARFFRRLNRLAQNPLLRTGLKLAGKSSLDRYYKNHIQSVRAALHDWDAKGRDLLFHGATAVIVVGSRPGASCPAEDALLATQNMLLGAHAMGLGTCLIGYAVEAIRRDRNIAQKLGIPDQESVHSVIALGYPEEEYVRCAERKPCVIRWSPPRKPNS